MADEDDDDTAITPQRFERMRIQRNQSRDRIAELEAELAARDEALATLTADRDAAAAKRDELAAQAETLARDLDGLRAATARAQAAAQAGITDPEILAVAEFAYGRVPEDGRPDFGEWLAAAAAKPEDAPVALRPHLAPPKPADPEPPPPRSGWRSPPAAKPVQPQDPAALLKTPEGMDAFRAAILGRG